MPETRSPSMDDLPGADPAKAVRRRFRRVQWAVTIGLIGALIYLAKPQEILEVLGRGKIVWLLLTFVILLFFNLIGGFNVWILLRRIIHVRLFRFLEAYILAWAAGLVTPGQVGDASQVLFLRSHGISYDKSSASYILDKFISLSVLFCVAMAGTIQYLPDLSLWKILAAPVVSLMAASIGLYLILHFPDQPALLRRVKNLTKNSLWQIYSFRNFKATVAMNVLLTLLKWAVLTFCYYCAFRSFSVELTFAAAAFIPIISTLVGYIPVTAGGIGTVEFTAVFLFGLEGISKASVMSAYLLLRSFQYLTAFIFVMLINHYLIRRPAGPAGGENLKR